MKITWDVGQDFMAPIAISAELPSKLTSVCVWYTQLILTTKILPQFSSNLLLFVTCYLLIVWRQCKTQNSGLRSKEEKPHDPINQPSRCNTQEVYCRLRKRVTLISWEAEHTKQQIGQAFHRQKPFYQHITYGLQSDWLHVCKAIPLVQTSRAFV